MFDIYEFINENDLNKYEIKDLFKEFILTVYDELDKKGYEALMIKFKENLDENDLI
jgi:hypothetical protein